MNALFLKDLAAKTHHGLRGRVEGGKSGGGICYGYRVIKRLDERGDRIRGDREINPARADVVRRIFRDFTASISPRAIAMKLNAEGVIGPETKLCNDTTIRGHLKRGTGVINNELYLGRLVWNRLHYVKDPSTGKHVSRLNPESERIVTAIPELRIIDDKLWQSVKAKQSEIAEKFVNVTAAIREHHSNKGFNSARRPKSLFSGLVFCGWCDGSCSLRSADRFVCSAHVGNGSCSNGRTLLRSELEQRVLEGLKDRLLAPEVVAEAMRAYAEETNRLNRERRASGDGWRAELAKVEKQIQGMVEAIKDGMFLRTMIDAMDALEARKAELSNLLSEASTDAPDILPSASQLYAKRVAHLTEALNRPEDRAEAAQTLRGLIERIVVRPGAKRGQIDVTLHGELGTILTWTAARSREKEHKRKLPQPHRLREFRYLGCGDTQHPILGIGRESYTEAGNIAAPKRANVLCGRKRNGGFGRASRPGPRPSRAKCSTDRVQYWSQPRLRFAYKDMAASPDDDASTIPAISFAMWECGGLPFFAPDHHSMAR
jgi:site-specific DNA recombinase